MLKQKTKNKFNVQIMMIIDILQSKKTKTT